MYPFTETRSADENGTSTSNTFGTIQWQVTTYKPNPFRGINGWCFAFDEWLHRCGMGHVRSESGSSWAGPWWTVPFRPFCNWWDRRLLGDDE
jgi:hypothetical protein